MRSIFIHGNDDNNFYTITHNLVWIETLKNPMKLNIKLNTFICVCICIRHI